MKKILASLMLTAALSLSPEARASVVTLGSVDWNTDTAATLTLQSVVPGGNQPQNIQCVICGANQPQQAGDFGYNNFGNQGGVGNYSMFSTATIGGSLGQNVIGTGYGVSFLQAYLASLNSPGFSIGIDINDTNQAQVLESFYFLNLTTHTVLAEFTTPTAVPSVNNGTGFPDYTLSGFSLAGVNPGDQVLFFARWSNANDGPESFFLVPTPTAAVPEPSTWAMLGLGFLGIGLLARRRARAARKSLRLV